MEQQALPVGLDSFFWGGELEPSSRETLTHWAMRYLDDTINDTVGSAKLIPTTLKAATEHRKYRKVAPGSHSRLGE